MTGSLVLPVEKVLLEILNSGMNPYVDQIQSSDLQLMYKKERRGIRGHHRHPAGLQHGLRRVLQLLLVGWKKTDNLPFCPGKPPARTYLTGGSVPEMLWKIVCSFKFRKSVLEGMSLWKHSSASSRTLFLKSCSSFSMVIL